MISRPKLFGIIIHLLRHANKAINKDGKIVCKLSISKDAKSTAVEIDKILLAINCDIWMK